MLPEEWEMYNLGDISKIRGGYGFSPDYQGVINEKIPFFKVSDMNSFGNETEMTSSNNYVSEEVVIKIGAKTFPKNTIIFPKVGGAVYTNKKRILVTDSLIDNNLMGVTSTSEDICSPDFLLFYFQTLDLKDISNPGPLPSINAQRVKSLKFPLPPLPEQHAIAATLRSVQEAKEKTDAVIAATKALKAAMMKHLFTYGPVPPEEAERVVLKETEIGSVPEGWKIQTVDQLFDSKLGKMLSPASKTGKFSKPYLRNANVQWGRVDISDLYEMDFSENNYDRYGLLSGDVLICEGGEIGRTAIWRGELKECYYQKAIHRLRPLSDRISQEFFSYHMMYAFLIGNTYPESGTTTTIAHLPGIKLKSLLIPLPPREEQDQIVTILSTIDQKLAAEQSHKEALDTLFKSLLHDLMTAKIRVKTDA